MKTATSSGRLRTGTGEEAAAKLKPNTVRRTDGNRVHLQTVHTPLPARSHCGTVLVYQRFTVQALTFFHSSFGKMSCNFSKPTGTHAPWPRYIVALIAMRTKRFQIGAPVDFAAMLIITAAAPSP